MMQLHLLLYRLFCLLEGLVHIAAGGMRRRLAMEFDVTLSIGLDNLKGGSEARSLVIFAPTVGEFNSVKPVIAQYRQRWSEDNLVLFTAYEQYLDLFKKTYPDAVVGLANFRTPWLVRRFFRKARPRLLIISEGPALHGRFPQRFEVTLPAACLAHKVPVVVTNAVLFERAFDSRIDQIENVLFSSLFTKSIRWWFPSFPSFRKALIREGVPPNQIQLHGDLRFDSLHTSGAPKNQQLEQLLDYYRASKTPILVAGSVNSPDEQQSVVDAWKRLRTRYPETKLIIAPRYVNNPDVIAALKAIISNADADFVLRSDPDSSERLRDILVIDVFGELSHYYSIATAGYIGRDHGVLEPLAYSCPTIVGKGWRTNYSASPLYEYMVSERGVILVADDAELADIVSRLFEDREFLTQSLATARDLIALNSGASQRIFSTLENLLTTPDMHS